MYNNFATHTEGQRPNSILLELIPKKSNERNKSTKQIKSVSNLLIHKKIRAAIEQRLLPEDRFYNLAGRVLTCHDTLLYSRNPNESDKGSYIARTTCKNALLCPHCSAILSRKRGIALNQVIEKHIKLDVSNEDRQFIMFTLTLPVIHISKLSEVYTAMSLARSALMKRVSQKESKHKLGSDFVSKFEFNYSAENTDYIRKDGSKAKKFAGHINPHFHLLFWLPKDFAAIDIVNFRAELSSIWYSLLSKYMSLNYNDYAKSNQEIITDVSIFGENEKVDFKKQIYEITKYLSKHSDIQSMHSQHFAAFLLALTGKRLFSAGGVFKNLKMMQIDDNDENYSDDTENNSDDTENNSFYYFDKETKKYKSVAVASELITLIRKLRSFRFSIVNYVQDGYVRIFYSLRIENAQAILYESRSSFSRAAPNFTRLTLDSQSPEWSILNQLIATNQLEFIPRPTDL